MNFTKIKEGEYVYKTKTAKVEVYEYTPGHWGYDLCIKDIDLTCLKRFKTMKAAMAAAAKTYAQLRRTKGLKKIAFRIVKAAVKRRLKRQIGV